MMDEGLALFSIAKAGIIPNSNTNDATNANTLQSINEEHLVAIRSLSIFLNELTIEDMSDEMFLSLQRLSIAIWSMIILPWIQNAINMNNLPSESLDILQLARSNLFVMEHTCRIDHVFLTSSTSAIAAILLHAGEYVDCISLLRKHISRVASIRSELICETLLSKQSTDDHILHAQRTSFTCAGSATQSFPGSATQSFSVTDVLIDLHTEMLFLYFRAEIRLCIRNSTTSSAVRTSTVRVKNAKTLSCISILNKFCANNDYYFAVLMCELAKAEVDTSLQSSLLKACRTHIESAEKEETAMLAAFSGSATQTISGSVTQSISGSATQTISGSVTQTISGSATQTISGSVTHPMVVGRTDDSVFIIPVNTRNIKIHSYSILCRETGTGAPVSAKCCDYSGCEVSVKIDAMTGCMQRRIVRISGLITGQTYMFASAGCDEEGLLIGTVSMSTPSIKIITPLSITLLFGALCETAFILHIPPLIITSSNTLYDQYITRLHQPYPISIPRGMSLFICDDPVLDLAAIRGQTPARLLAFVRAFLYAEKMKFLRVSDPMTEWHDSKVVLQLRLLSSLRSTVVFSYATCAYLSPSTSVSLITHALNLIHEVLKLCGTHMYMYIEGPILILLTLLQSIDSKVWTVYMYSVHSRLTLLAVQCALYNHNSACATIVFESLPDIIDSASLTSKLEYVPVVRLVRSCASVLMSQGAAGKLMAVLAVPVESRRLWTVSQLCRGELLRGMSVALVENKLSPDATILDSDLREPMCMSAYIHTLCELIEDASSATTTPGNTPCMIIGKILCKYVIKSDNLLSDVTRVVRDMCVPFVVMGHGNGANESDESERRAQLRNLSTLLLRICSIVWVDRRKNIAVNIAVNPAVNNDVGPYTTIDLDQSFIDTYNIKRNNVESSNLMHNTADSCITLDSTKLSITDIGYVHCLVASISLLSKADSLSNAVSVIVKLWNYIIDKWITPYAFSAEYDSKSAYIKTSFDDFLLAWSLSINSNSITESASKTYAFCIKNMLLFWFKVLFIKKDYEHVITFGKNILCIMIRISVEIAREFVELFSLMTYAQDMRIQQAEEIASKAQISLNLFKATFVERQQSTRKKKLRIAVVGLDADEQQYEVDLVEYTDKLCSSQTYVRDMLRCKDEICELLDRYTCVNVPNEWRWHEVKCCIDRLMTNARNNADADGGMCSLEESMQSVLKDVDKLLSTEREQSNPNRRLLFDILVQKGDVYLTLNNIPLAMAVYRQSLDTLFNCLDSYNNWQNICIKTINITPIDRSITHSIISAICVLGKLIRYCTSNNSEVKLKYALFAAELSMVPFKESIGHPMNGYAAYRCYICTCIGGLNSVIYLHSITAYVLNTIAYDVLNVLITHEYVVQSFPLITLMEHFHAVHTRRIDLWLLIRLYRISALIDSNCYAEATSMFSSIKSTLIHIYNNTYAHSDDESIVHTRIVGGASTTYDASPNGLLFNGLPPYYNNLPPFSEVNKACMVKLAMCIEDLRTCLLTYKYDVINESNKGRPISPNIELSTGKDSPSKPSKQSKVKPKEDDCPAYLSVPIFDKVMESRMYYVYAKLLVKLGKLDDKCVQGGIPTLRIYTSDGENIIINNLQELVGETSDSGTTLLLQYRLLQVEVLYSKMQYTDVHTNVSISLAALQNIHINTPTAVYECSYIWFKFKLILVKTLCIQNRYQQMYEECSSILLNECGDSGGECGNSGGKFGNSGGECSNSGGKWMRMFLYYKAIALTKLARKNDARKIIDEVITSYEQHKLSDVILVKCYIMRASLSRASAFLGTVDPAKFLTISVTSLRCALTTALSLAHIDGFTFTQSGMTYVYDESMVATTCSYPPLLQSFIPYGKHDGNGKHGKQDGKQDGNGKHETILFGPIDEADTYVKSPYANIYLSSVRALVSCYSAMCVLYEEIQSTAHMPHILEYLRDGNGKQGGKQDGNGKQGGKQDGNGKQESKDGFIREWQRVAEDGLRVMKYVYNCPPIIRATLLISAGKSRLLHQGINSTMASKEYADVCMAPLHSAIKLSLSTWQYSPLLKSACLCLANWYGISPETVNSRGKCVDVSMMEEERLKLACMYVHLSCRISANYTNLTEFPLTTISSSKSVTLPTAVNTIMSGILYVRKSSDSKQVIGMPTVREILLYMSNMCKSMDILWRDSKDWQIVGDLQQCLSKASQEFATSVIIQKLPDLTTFCIADDCISVSWEIRLNHDTNECMYVGYVVLGGIGGTPLVVKDNKEKKKVTGPVITATSTLKKRAPLLKRIELSFPSQRSIATAASILSETDVLHANSAVLMQSLLSDVSAIICGTSIVVSGQAVTEEGKDHTLHLTLSNANQVEIPISSTSAKVVSTLFTAYHDAYQIEDAYVCSFLHECFDAKPT